VYEVGYAVGGVIVVTTTRFTIFVIFGRGLGDGTAVAKVKKIHAKAKNNIVASSSSAVVYNTRTSTVEMDAMSKDWKAGEK
jgi:hypothetical protein